MSGMSLQDLGGVPVPGSPPGYAFFAAASAEPYRRAT
jgi:hypothetical protein